MTGCSTKRKTIINVYESLILAYEITFSGLVANEILKIKPNFTLVLILKFSLKNTQ